MTKGINIGQFRSVNIVDYTHAFDIEFFRRYIEEALTCVPKEHLKSVENINIYDECPSHFPVVARGGHYPFTEEEGAELDIYLNQNLGHLLPENHPKGKLSRFLDAVFIRTFGKYFIIHTLLHELGHHVYNLKATIQTKDDDTASENFAEQYANDIYNKTYPLHHRYYWLFNGLYHLLYWRRIMKDDEIRRAKKAV
ncbi:MAG: hypothetical protein A2X54_10240 [Nitrospirae bacterium GWF2_44_13]|nr:MAG: hypothetical protein A2X54_10240 [Nitrospirae bacterium GWF2_44_13]OGW66029.1 MAG: hypothetical protein A2222_09105 [Nitrospirae bacterium RIFOXYA2_FULL_44_9]OGW74386.1 MAG: hypothetical protein A2484_01615 [Nitrospirae bacterium RIFOXYC2_FULL_44_7]HBG92760.1 hypothetical protein [Nitrospiraceae bacterium]HBU05590.1 hypothetical protein [Nitrospiraceae bacterium]